MIIHGDCLAVLPALEENSVDSVVTDPPYHLVSIVKRFGGPSSAPARFGTDGAYARASAGFMGKQWDGGNVAFRPETWAEVWRVMKPGAYLLAFGGTRTYHRMACAIEDAGFEIRDMLGWLYGTGFPKSHDVSKDIDKRAGVEREVISVGERSATRPHVSDQSGGKAYRFAGDASITAPATDAARQWSGWGTALKPAQEPIVMARKPLIGTVAENVLAYGTGAINIDACRVSWPNGIAPEIGTPGWGGPNKKLSVVPGQDAETVEREGPSTLGRFPANIAHDGSPEVLAAFASYGESKSGIQKHPFGKGGIWSPSDGRPCGPQYGDSGTAARFFYCAKASKADRNEGLGGAKNPHPTVKPEALMRYLCRLVTPPGGLVLDPFAGSGSTGKAAILEGFRFTGIEKEDEYVPVARARIAAAIKRMGGSAWDVWGDQTDKVAAGAGMLE